MGTRRTRVAVMSTLVLVLAALGSEAAGSETRAFSLVLTGNANPVPTSDPCVLINTETGTGLSPQLGLVSWESREVVNFCVNPEGADIEGAFTITTWNRDRIQGRYHTIAQADFEAGEITAIGRYEITDGTGRLRAVTGKGVIAAAGSLTSPYAFSGGLFGRITY